MAAAVAAVSGIMGGSTAGVWGGSGGMARFTLTMRRRAAACEPPADDTVFVACVGFDGGDSANTRNTKRERFSATRLMLENLVIKRAWDAILLSTEKCNVYFSI